MRFRTMKCPLYLVVSEEYSQSSRYRTTLERLSLGVVRRPYWRLWEGILLVSQTSGAKVFGIKGPDALQFGRNRT